MRWIYLLVLHVFLFIPSSAQAGDLQAAIQQIKDGKAVLVDVREAVETKDGMIEGALWIATSEIKSESEAYRKGLAGLPKDKPVYTYCASGKRSGNFTSLLLGKGYSSQNLGGYKDLVAAGMKTKK